MINEIHENASQRIKQLPELSTLTRDNRVTLSQITLYVDDGAILALGPTLKETSQILKVTFKETHKWLQLRGLKTDETKSELMHFN